MSDATTTQAGRTLASRPELKLDVTFQTEPPRKANVRHTEYVAAGLYHLVTMIPLKCSAAIAQAVEGIVERWTVAHEEGLKREVQRLLLICESAGIATDLSYTQPQTVTITVTTPYLTRFIRMLEQVDRACQLADALWMNGKFNASQRTQCAFHAANRAARYAGKIRNLKNHFNDLSKLGKTATVEDLGPEFAQWLAKNDGDSARELNDTAAAVSKPAAGKPSRAA